VGNRDFLMANLQNHQFNSFTVWGHRLAIIILEKRGEVKVTQHGNKTLFASLRDAVLIPKTEMR